MAANLIFFNKLLTVPTIEFGLYLGVFEWGVARRRLGLLEACISIGELVSSGAMQAAIRAPPMLFSRLS